MISGSSYGRYGHIAWRDNEDEARCWSTALPVESVLNRKLGDGCRIRVTIEVLDSGAELRDNPWKPPVGSTWDEYEDYLAWSKKNPGSDGYGKNSAFCRWRESEEYLGSTHYYMKELFDEQANQ